MAHMMCICKSYHEEFHEARGVDKPEATRLMPMMDWDKWEGFIATAFISLECFDGSGQLISSGGGLSLDIM